VKISIITVSFNSEGTIRQTIDSVFSQDYNDIEYIIIDGSSTDETCSIINTYEKKISYFISEKDDGIYDAMNKGIRAATGDVIGILNSDDFYADKHVISDVVKKFKSEKTDSLYADLIYVDTENTDKVKRYWKSNNFSRNKIKKGWTLPHPTFFVKKSVYDMYGLYSIRLKSSADYEMILRLLYKNCVSVYYFPKILVKMRAGGFSNNNLYSRIRGNREDVLAWNLNNLNIPFLLRYRKPLSKLNQFFKKP
tara:strand:+ start:70568 stop:71320 length:753 start_codon:yes stop_codon:yes gene_type:complete